LARSDALGAPPVGGPPYESVLGLGGASTSFPGLRRVDEAALDAMPFRAADVVVARSLADADRAIRPHADVERGLVRPRGTIVLASDGSEHAPLGAAIRERGLVVTSSRCGDFRAALDLLGDVSDLAERLVTATVPADRLADAFAMAADPRH